MSESLPRHPLPETELARIRVLEARYNAWKAMLPVLQAAQVQWREARAWLAELHHYTIIMVASDCRTCRPMSRAACLPTCRVASWPKTPSGTPFSRNGSWLWNGCSWGPRR